VPDHQTTYSPLWNLTLARLREFYRQPEAIFWVYFFPILMVVALGIAFRNKPIEVITVDIRQSPYAAPMMQALATDERIQVDVFDATTCRQRLRTGKSDLYLDPGESELAVEAGEHGNRPQVEYYYDPTRPGSIVARDLVDQLIQTTAGRVDPVKTEAIEVTEPGGRYIDFLVPGLLGMGIMGGGLWGVGFAVVDMRIRKLLKRFVATPMRKSQFLMGIMISRMFFMVPEIIVLVVFSRIFFGVQVFGSWWAIVSLILLGAVQFSGIGLLVASRAKTLETVSGLMNLVMIPMWTLSGIFFSYERFPEVVHPLIQMLPLTPLNDALRAVMLEGASLTSQWTELSIMTIWAIATFVGALALFRWNN
jgi:ABC-type multidrug transport system permease subunit